MSRRDADAAGMLETLTAAPPLDRWLALPVVTAAVTELYFLWSITLRYDRPPMTPDAAIFQHIGWYLTRGARLYVDAWEPKLPLPYEITGILALLSGGDMYLLHLLSVLLMMVSACVIVCLVTLLTYDVTGDRFASSVAGASMLLLPGFAVRPAYGYKAKYIVLLGGLLAIYLYIRGYPVLSGVAAAASVGHGQTALVFPLLVVGMALRQGDMRSLVRIIAGGLGFTAVMLLPVFVLWRSVPEMLVQTVLVPLSARESTPLFARIVAGVVHFKWGSPFVLVGGIGLGRVAVGVFDDRNGPVGRDEWWILLGAGWYAFLIFFLDFEPGGYTDLIPGLAFVAIGIGIVAASLRGTRPRRFLAAGVAAVLLVNVVFLGSFGLVFTAVETPGPVPMADLQTNERAQEQLGLETVPDVRYIYWNRLEPTSCHYRLSLMEVQWLERTQPRSVGGCLDFASARDALDHG